jgi:Family of unknown function (DUF6328)
MGFRSRSGGNVSGMAEDETEGERLDRNFADLLQELRVAQAGVQILFAFLLTLPFSARFGAVDAAEEAIYVVALLSAATSAAMIIAPVAYHRALFRRGRKREIVRSAHRMASGGLAFLLVSMVGSVFLVMDFVLGRPLGIVIGAASFALFVLLWGALPYRRRHDPDDLPAER